MGFTKRVESKEVLVTTYHDVKCDRCDEALVEQPGFTNSMNLQYDNALIMEFHGGYGMFVDRLEEDPEGGFDELYSSLLCHKCAHSLVEWLGIKDRGWHVCENSFSKE
ncbi:MAG: hypothetical protein ACKOW9_02225 [Candidatus Paceibacterota bacterium]